MRQATKLRHLMKQYDLDIKGDDQDNIRLLVTNKKDQTIGIFESKGIGNVIQKAYLHMKKQKRNI